MAAHSSWVIPPSANTRAKPMNPKVKKWIKGTRSFQLALRCLEIICSVGLLVLMILIRGIEPTTGWIMRIVVRE
jgi:hypothetical protein